MLSVHIIPVDILAWPSTHPQNKTAIEIQTDRPTYLPGETVQARIKALPRSA